MKMVSREGDSVLRVLVIILYRYLTYESLRHHFLHSSLNNQDDCEGGHICFQRDANQAVPGCVGGESGASRTDYCIRDPTILSEPPSGSPSVSPTGEPTASVPPTDFPTHSSNPSQRPTKAPSPRPSDSPTNVPTPTVVAVGPFQLKLHWTRRSCWTGSGNEIPNCKEEVTKWCMQCEGHQCNVGDILWVEPCRDDAPIQQLFQWYPLLSTMEVQVSGSQPQERGQLQMQTKDSTEGETLCLQRRLGTQNHTLQPCDDSLEEQWYQGFDVSEPFELVANTAEKVLPYCLTTPHHPRQFEEIIHSSCAQSRKDRTSQWKALWPDLEIAREKSFNERRYYRIGSERRSPSCSETRRCGMCQGDCDSDEDCNGVYDDVVYRFRCLPLGKHRNSM